MDADAADWTVSSPSGSDGGSAGRCETGSEEEESGGSGSGSGSSSGSGSESEAEGSGGEDEDKESIIVGELRRHEHLLSRLFSRSAVLQMRVFELEHINRLNAMLWVAALILLGLKEFA